MLDIPKYVEMLRAVQIPNGDTCLNTVILTKMFIKTSLRIRVF